MNRYKAFLIIFSFTLIFYVPVLSNLDLFLLRGNDLQEFFWPIFYYTKESIHNYLTIPTWNPWILSGTPLIPDPQSMLFYPPNIIFLLLPFKIAFLLSFIAYSIIGGIGIYFIARKLNFVQDISIFIACCYISAPRFAAYLEAGHFGLIAAWGITPLAFLFAMSIYQEPNLLKSILLSILLLFILNTHIITFFLVFFSIFIIFISKSQKKKINIFYFVFVSFLTIGLSAISLLPSLEWQSETTRQILLHNPEIYPQWKSFTHIVKATILPEIFGINFIQTLTTEEYITSGMMLSTLSLLGLMKLRKNERMITLAITCILLAIILSSHKKLVPLIIDIPIFPLLRVVTRVWFILYFIVLYLCAIYLSHIKSNIVKYVIMCITIAELTMLSWIYLAKLPNTIARAPINLLNELQLDSSDFRVFCTSMCISQKDAAEKHIQLIEGYSTLVQMNYYEYAWQLTGEWWNYYTLAIPPFGISQFEQIIPDTKALGAYNTKYIVSPYQINSQRLSLLNRFDGYYLYKNQDFMEKVINGKIVEIRPNSIKVLVTDPDKPLKISLVYTKGWRAINENNKVLEIVETSDKLIEIKDTKYTKIVYVYYDPFSYSLGKTITISSLIFCILVLLALFSKQIKTNAYKSK